MIKLGNRFIKEFNQPYVIAEIGANHNGDMQLAKKMIDSAKSCGVDAVKFQSWTPESIVSKEEYDNNLFYKDSVKKHFGSLREMVEKYYLRPEQHIELKTYCDNAEIEFFSTPFTVEEADLLEEIKVPFYKIASMDINHLSFLKHVARKKKPVIISTGMASLAEIDKAIETVEGEGNRDIILLHCISIYPPKYEDINLSNIPMLRKTFGYPVGFSDHTIGVSIPLASVALGCCVIEKHFTLDKDLPGWDHEVSANPKEMRTIVNESIHIAKALGTYQRVVGADEQEKIFKFRRSIVAGKDLKKGHKLSMDDLAFKRPGTGIRPDEYKYLIGRTLNQTVAKDQLLSWDNLS